MKMEEQKKERQKESLSSSNRIQRSRDAFEKGLDFILNHFNQERLFPRTIMTRKLGYQKEVFSKEQALQYFKESDFIDCRINAFPSFTEFKGIQRYPPNFIFIDIDRNNFDTDRGFKIAISKTLKNITEELGGYPTVLLTGGGYHIYQPIDAFVLEQEKIFNKFDNSSEQFVRFAEDHLSNNEADQVYHPSFKSCLLRIPFSFNSKYLLDTNSRNSAQVKIIQKWNNEIPSIKYLLYEFHRYLTNEKVNKWNSEQKSAKRFSHVKKYRLYDINKNNTIWWIEKRLDLPISDFRKNATNLILAPYMIVVKKVSYSEAFEILTKWLDRCNSERRLNFNSNELVKYALNYKIKRAIPPMKLDTLKNKDPQLYFKLIN